MKVGEWKIAYVLRLIQRGVPETTAIQACCGTNDKDHDRDPVAVANYDVEKWEKELNFGEFTHHTGNE